LRSFLTAIGVDFQKGLSSLNTPLINLDFIALTMRNQQAPDMSNL
jgi:hypothetical protein